METGAKLGMNETTTLDPAFQEFPKMARLSRECIITEKIDGTNACLYISDDTTIILAGSRNGWIPNSQDNFGFRKWVVEHAEELLKLGPGRHFGEWWGQGIQRGYGQKEKRFSLFNALRWCNHDAEPQIIPTQDPRTPPKYQTPVPACVSVVPIIARGIFNCSMIDASLSHLIVNGSVAAPGFMKPEGIVLYHIAGDVGFKKTIDKDYEYKGKR